MKKKKDNIIFWETLSHTQKKINMQHKKIAE